MTPNSSSNWRILAGLAGAMLASCGGGESADSGAPSGAVTGGAGAATLSWAAPNANMDGSAVTNLAGYRIYHGTSASSLSQMIQVSNPGISLYVVDGLSTGTHYFAVTAYNTSGVESDRSPVASKSIL